MQCPACGPEPEIVIVDGCVLGPAAKFLSGKLDPPTRTYPYSASRPEVVRGVVLHSLVPDGIGLGESEIKEMKKRIKNWCREEGNTKGLKLKMPETLEEDLARLKTRADASHEGALHFYNFLVYYRSLRGTDDSRQHIRRFLKQIISEDMILQIVPPLIHQDLKTYIDTTRPSQLLFQCFPILKHIHDSFPLTIPSEILGILCILLKRAETVLSLLKQNAKAIAGTMEVVETERGDPDWKITGSCYGGKVYRRRPKYTKIDGDGGSDKEKKADSCNKYYESYGKRNGLIGGMCGFWCPHGICVGFHLMPKAEGRNDVFAGLLSHWSVAPKVVIYDFACQLGSYCMIREPAFFEKTRFYVDELHAKGHTACSAASLLAPAMEQDPDLRAVNSSAAECAHSTFDRIRKSLSYMKEETAILMLWSMIQIWNRRKLAKMESSWKEKVGKRVRAHE